MVAACRRRARSWSDEALTRVPRRCGCAAPERSQCTWVNVRTLTTSTQLDALTGARGVLCLWVFMLHVAMVLRLGLQRDLGGIFTEAGAALVWSGYLGVDGFFLLSGFVMALVYGERLGAGCSVWSFWRARVARIYPLHLVVLVAVFAIPVLVFNADLSRETFPPDLDHHSGGDAYSLGGLVSSVLLVQSWGWFPSLGWSKASWSISSEWALYALFPVLVPVLVRRVGRGWLPLLLAPLPLALALVVIHLAPAGAQHVEAALTWYAASDAERAGFIGRTSPVALEFGLLRALGGFITGCLLQRAWLDDGVRQLPWRRLGTIGLGLVLVGTMVGPGWLANLGLVPVIMSLAMPPVQGQTGLCASNCWQAIAAWRPLVWLGDRSYSLYLWHIPLLGAGLGIGNRIGLGFVRDWPVWGVWCWWIVILVVVVLVADVSYRLIERPCRRWLRGAPAPKPEAEPVSPDATAATDSAPSPRAV